MDRSKQEYIQDVGCSFRVFRKRRAKKVVTISLWKGNIGYVFNLSNTILWWGRNMEELYPGWNVRFYIDNNIFRSMEGDIDWYNVIDQLKQRRNVEVWLYFCEWGHDAKGRCKNCHSGTFGSLLRFHAFQDPNVNIAISRNVEMLSSPKMSRIVHHWAGLHDKQYHILYNIADGYSCGYNNPKMCQDVNMTGVNTVLATFGFKKTKGLPNPYPNLFYEIRKYISKHPVLKKFPYGVDEVVLTHFFKPLMTEHNTYTTPRQLLNQAIPDVYNWNGVFEYIFDFLKNLPEVLSRNKRNIFNSIFDDWFWKSYMTYNPIHNLRILVTIGSLTEKMPDVAIDMLRYVKQRIKPHKNERKIMDRQHRKMTKFYFHLFKNNVLQKGQNNNRYNFFIRAGTRRKAELMFYMITKSVVFDYVDFPGVILKTKAFETKQPVFGPVTEEDVMRSVQEEKRLWKIRPHTKHREIPSDKYLENKMRKYLQYDIDRKKRDYEKNRQIFLRNIREVYLFGDRDYA